jgi:HK97 family phage portal protein
VASLLSDIAKAVAVRTPVPMAQRTRGSGLFHATPSADSQANMRAYGAMGTIFSCVSLYATATGRVQWHLYRKQPVDGRTRYTKNDEGSDQRVQVIKHQALSVLNNPNPFTTRFSLFELGQTYMDLAGESPWVVQRDPRATFPTGLWQVRPDRLEPVPDPAAYLKGWVYTSPDGMERIPLGVDEVIFNRYPNPVDPYRGLGPVQSVLVDSQSAEYSASWNRNFFINSAIPGGVIEAPNNLSDDEWDDLTTRWRETHRGVARAHRVAVLEGGAKWVPNQMSMRDMDFAALRNLSRDVIREAFRMHKVMLGVSDDVNRANAQTGEEVFSAWGVVPRLDRWRDLLNGFFLPMFYPPGAEIPVEFDYVTPIPANRELDNLELTSKTAALALLVPLGFDPDDACEVVGLPKMGFTKPAAPAPPALPAAPGEAGDTGVPSADTAGDDTTNRLIKMLGNGHMPVLRGSLR